MRAGMLKNGKKSRVRPAQGFVTIKAKTIAETEGVTLEEVMAKDEFGRDTILPIKIHANWTYIREQRQKEIRRNNARENRTRKEHTYSVGDKVLLDKPGILRKLETPRTGPHKVEAVYANGTIRIRKGVVSERVNIRRVHPYYD